MTRLCIVYGRKRLPVDVLPYEFAIPIVVRLNAAAVRQKVQWRYCVEDMKGVPNAY